jgi:transcriptional regulator with XRE-family HTH domain
VAYNWNLTLRGFLMHRDMSKRLSKKVIEYVLHTMGISQEELAERMEVSASSISRVRRGERGLTVHHLLVLEKVMDCALGTILLTVNPEPRESPGPVLNEMYKQAHALSVVAGKATEVLFRNR